MPERSSNPGNQTPNRGKGKKPQDAKVRAFNIVQQAIGDKPKEHSAEKPERIRLRYAWYSRGIVMPFFREYYSVMALGGLPAYSLDRTPWLRPSRFFRFRLCQALIRYM